MATVQVARQYTQTGDLEQARVQLATLAVPNPQQWLAHVAETQIAAQPNIEETVMLVRLAVALGTYSEIIRRFAQEKNIPLPGFPGAETGTLSSHAAVHSSKAELLIGARWVTSVRTSQLLRAGTVWRYSL